MNVHDYFTQQLGRAPVIDGDAAAGWRDIPVDSGCGDDCKTAIDAARAFLEITRKAGSHCHVEPCVLETTAGTINTFIFG